MSCTLEKVLSDARTLLERLKEHDTAAEGLIEQSSALNQRIHCMKEVGNALPDKVSLNCRYNQEAGLSASKELSHSFGGNQLCRH